MQVFPHVAADHKLYAYTLTGYWMDVGQPKDYLKGGSKAVHVYTCIHNTYIHIYTTTKHKPSDLLNHTTLLSCTVLPCCHVVGHHCAVLCALLCCAVLSCGLCVCRPAPAPGHHADTPVPHAGQGPQLHWKRTGGPQCQNRRGLPDRAGCVHWGGVCHWRRCALVQLCRHAWLPHQGKCLGA